jgi:hypothetical protein
MAISFEQALTEVWRQVLVENAELVALEKERYRIPRDDRRVAFQS